MRNYTPAGTATSAVWIHDCWHVEWWPTAPSPEMGPITEQGCDACESAPDGTWRRLYVEAPDQVDMQQVSDGHHTFAELYAHRRALTAALAAAAGTAGDSWRSREHHPDDDPMYPGYFVVGIDLSTGPITYHYGLEYWDDFAAVPERAHAPRWDGAAAGDTVSRLLELARMAAEER